MKGVRDRVDGPAQRGLFEAPEPAPPAASTAQLLRPGEALPQRDGQGDAVPGFRHPLGDREIELAGQRVGYALRRARRRTIGFVVGPQGLRVSAPRGVPLAEIESALRSKSAWILRKLVEQRQRAGRQQDARIDWCDGATIPFLGTELSVAVEYRADQRRASVACSEVDAAMPGASLCALVLRVALPAGAAPALLRHAVESWLRSQALRVFADRTRHFAPRLGVEVKRLALSSARTRWGSASASGAIRLNWRLIHFQLATIDYVIAHELSHLREMNHSARFWDVVRSVLPDYERARSALRRGPMPMIE